MSGLRIIRTTPQPDDVAAAVVEMATALLLEDHRTGRLAEVPHSRTDAFTSGYMMAMTSLVTKLMHHQFAVSGNTLVLRTAEEAGP